MSTALKFLPAFLFHGVVSASYASAYEFSEYGFTSNSARLDNSLLVEMAGRSSLREYGLLTRVGGVNFQNAIDLSNYQIGLDFNDSNLDGSNVEIQVNDTTYTLPIFNWELRPIVEYADSEFTSAISIFGEGPESETYRYIDYHPAFENTHLGMRLLQADVFLMDPLIFSEAPTINGKTVYYPGESNEVDLFTRILLSAEITEIMERESFQSWILTDVDAHSNLLLDGLLRDYRAYYYVWSTDQITQILKYNDLIESAERQYEEYEQALEDYEAARPGSKEEKDALKWLEELEVKLAPLLEKIDSLYLEISSSDPDVIEAESINSGLNDSEETLENIVPFVYSAVQKTARFSALFRGVKKSHPEEWLAFKDKVLRSVSLAPSITPNQFER